MMLSQIWLYNVHKWLWFWGEHMETLVDSTQRGNRVKLYDGSGVCDGRKSVAVDSWAGCGDGLHCWVVLLRRIVWRYRFVRFRWVLLEFRWLRMSPCWYQSQRNCLGTSQLRRCFPSAIPFEMAILFCDGYSVTSQSDSFGRLIHARFWRSRFRENRFWIQWLKAGAGGLYDEQRRRYAAMISQYGCNGATQSWGNG